MNVRVRWLRDSLRSLNLDGMIVSNPVNIKYLIGVEAEGILLITRKENVYITDGRYIEAVNSILTIDDEIIVSDIKDISSYDCENFFLFCENVGFEENYVTYAKYKQYMHQYKINNFVETEYIIEKHRMIKDKEEIENITEACKITDKCFDHLLTYIKKGKTEKEIATEIERFFKENGAEGNSFDPIVASGINSSMPHAVPTDRKIQSGDIITIDFGCRYKGYCSDMTRTIFVDFVQDYIKDVYDLVLKNQRNMFKEIKEGANTKNLFRMVNSDFKVNGFSLIHGLGHGVGLDIHESPSLGERSEMLLKENMVVTNEPGIYIPGKFGVRIEDTVLVNKYGCTSLTKSDKNYIIIKA